MKTKFKISDLNATEKRIVLAMLNNSPFSGVFVISALSYYTEAILKVSDEELNQKVGGFISAGTWKEIAKEFNKYLLLDVTVN